jgi:hypothetical protein
MLFRIVGWQEAVIGHDLRSRAAFIRSRVRQPFLDAAIDTATERLGRCLITYFRGFTTIP